MTLRDIAADEELLVDYAMSTTDPACFLRCHCASYRCRQMVEGTDWRIPQLQRGTPATGRRTSSGSSTPTEKVRLDCLLLGAPS